MILTLLFYFAVGVLVAVALLAALAVYNKYRRKKDVKRMWATITGSPRMVGLAKTIEDFEAERVAKKLADDIEFDLFQPLPPTDPPTQATTKEGLDAMFGYYDDKGSSDDDWSTVEEEPAKPMPKKRKAKKKASRVGKARRKGPRVKR